MFLDNAQIIETLQEYELPICLSQTNEQAVRKSLREFQLYFKLNKSKGTLDFCTRNKKTDTHVEMEISPTLGIRDYHILRVSRFLVLHNNLENQFLILVKKLFKAYLEKDALLVEVESLVLNNRNEFLITSMNMRVDKNSFQRHKQYFEFAKSQLITSAEKKCHQNDINHLPLKGDVGCIVNGEGIAMASIDCIKQYGLNPGPLFDIQGSATAKKFRIAYDLLLKDSNVKCRMVNIFGGMIKCDLIAVEIINSIKGDPSPETLVIRLIGTHDKTAINLLAENGITAYRNLEDALGQILTIMEELNGNPDK